MKSKAIKGAGYIASILLGSMLFASVALAEDTGVDLGDAIVITADVVGIDKANRIVTIVGPQGNVFDVVAGNDVRNFDQIRVGDQIKLTYYESVAVFIGAPGSQPEADATTIAARAPKGAMPGGMIVSAVDLSVTVKAIDKKKRELTVELPGGNDVQTKVDPSVKAFDSLKTGDSINARVTRAVAVAVESD